MSVDLQAIQSRLDDVLSRVKRLEVRLDCDDQPDNRWQFLVARPHPWRRQLSIKGRNITVGQLMATIRANGLNPEEASDDLALPVEAIREATSYFEQNRELIALEAAEERRRMAERGYALEPEDLPR